MELDEHYYHIAVNAIPLLANLYREGNTLQEAQNADAIIQQASAIPVRVPLAPFLQRRLF